MTWNGQETHPLPLDELVYLRFHKEELNKDMTLGNAMLKAPDQSVNRSGYGGKSWYTLMPEPKDETNPDKVFKKLCMGIVAFPVSAVPATIQPPHEEIDKQHPTYTIVVEHAPESHNYYHCEIRLYVGAQRLTKEAADRLREDDKKPFSLVKKLYRDKLRKALEANGTLRFVLETAEADDTPAWHRFAPACVLKKMR